MSEPVLEIRAASLPLSDGTATTPVSFQLRPGEVGAVMLPEEVTGLPLADAASGLVAPVAGEVLFQGASWARLGPTAESATRGRIGRIFEGRAWMSNLDLDENIVLSLVHQGKRNRAGWLKEARELAEEVGLGVIPDKRPAWITPRESLLAQWVRALLGDKPLLVLELPVRALDADDIGLCTAALNRRLARGAAALVAGSIERSSWLRNLPVSLTMHAKDFIPETP